VMGIFLQEMRGRSVVLEASELMATFVLQNGDLAQRDPQTICESAASRRASVASGVGGQFDESRSSVTWAAFLLRIVFSFCCVLS
jgi:hypothetical protein